MKKETLISATLALTSIAFLSIEIMTNNVFFWMVGMTFFIAVVFRLFDSESRSHESNSLTDKPL